MHRPFPIVTTWWRYLSNSPKNHRGKAALLQQDERSVWLKDEHFANYRVYSTSGGSNERYKRGRKRKKKEMHQSKRTSDNCRVRYSCFTNTRNRNRCSGTRPRRLESGISYKLWMPVVIICTTCKHCILPVQCIQGVPGGMCQTSGECSLC